MKKKYLLILLSSASLGFADQSYDQQNDSYTYQNGSQTAVPDQAISQEIHDSIGSGWFSKGFENVSFDVRNGTVYLKGTVDTPENRMKVENSVKKIKGVRQVNNQIAFSKQGHNAYFESQLSDSEKKYPHDSAFSQQDRQINAKIRSRMNQKWPLKGLEALVLKTANGVVIISGTVDRPEDAKKISEQIKEIEVVKSVNNQLILKE